MILLYSGCCLFHQSPFVNSQVTRKFFIRDGTKEGLLLIKFKSDLPQEDIEQLLSQYGFLLVKKIEGLDVFQVKIPDGCNTGEIIEILSKDSRIQYIEPDYIRSIN